MKDKDIQAEFEQLRTQLSELRLAREELEAQSAEKAENPAVSEDAGNSNGTKLPDSHSVVDNKEAEEPELMEALMTQFQELFNELDKDIKQTKPATLLVIFAMGVLVGRILSR